MPRLFLFTLVFFSYAGSLFAAMVDFIIQPSGTIGNKPPIGILSNMISYAIGIAAILGVIGITW